MSQAESGAGHERGDVRVPLEPITLHEARHTCASILIAAGVNAKALSVIMGHATIAMTLDTYGHLMPGGLDEAAAQTNAYLARLGGDRPALSVVSSPRRSTSSSRMGPFRPPRRA
jgi:integrase